MCRDLVLPVTSKDRKKSHLLLNAIKTNLRGNFGFKQRIWSTKCEIP